jgi:glycerol-3-phosphate O-acyltransferase/dihydroxyacetone phosphate acyltransferase
MFEQVWQELKNNNCIGIFPEGGSHDRPNLLPLKAGVCIMALGAMVKFKCDVKILTCGINYYKQDAL